MKKKKLSPIRQAQKTIMQGSAKVGNTTADFLKGAGKRLQKLDDQLGMTVLIHKGSEEALEQVRRVNEKLGVSDKAVVVTREVSDLASKAKQSTDNVADQAGVYKAADTVSDLVTVQVTAPAQKLLRKYEIDARLAAIGDACENLYGSTRGVIKPYFLPDTPEQLLRETKRELAYISACIMQISPGEAEKIAAQFGTVVAAKIAGVAASGALLSLVSTFGTAGTGTAIATLSGAASTSATLAWVGSLLGGGMAAGAVLTGGVSIIVGLGAYKALRSKRRDFDSLGEIEQRIVQYCWMLMAIIDDHIENKNGELTADGAHALLEGTLMPLQALLVENSESICSNLDSTSRIAFRQHVLRDFNPAIIEPFLEYSTARIEGRSRHFEYVIGGVIYALLTRSIVDDSHESQLVLDALRRSDNDLATANEAQLSDYLSSYEPEQLRGIASNVKGIYHELLWVEQYNTQHESSRAELFDATNHVGSDVRIIDVESGEVVMEYQLKATDSIAYLNEHLQKYPDISIVVTDELSAEVVGAQSSGNTNADLTEATNENLDALAGNAIDDRVMEALGLAGAVATGQELIEMLQGNKEFPEAVKAAIAKTGTAGAATAVAAYLFT